MRSMTGFGRGAASGEGLEVVVRLRAVNHRNLDVVVRTGEELRPLENTLRERLARRLARGRVELQVELQRLATSGEGPRLDEGAVAGYVELRDRLLSSGVLNSDRLDLAELLRMPGVLAPDASDCSLSEGEQRVVFEALESALDQLEQARTSEGEKLAAALEERRLGLGTVQEDLAELRQGHAETLRAQLEERLEQLLEGRNGLPDETRLAQEVVLLVDRSDVSEELDRLGSHLEHLEEILVAEGSIGKRLDFLAQEIFRELNTIAAKCRDSAMTRRVLDGKVLCEQLREQIQNIE